jgi:small subunit ribosomal protein S16
MVGILEPQYRVGKIAGMVVKSGSAAKSLVKEAEPRTVVENMEGGTEDTAKAV